MSELSPWAPPPSWPNESSEEGSERTGIKGYDIHDQDFTKTEDGSTSLSDDERSEDHSLSTVPMGHTANGSDLEDERWGCQSHASKKPMRFYYFLFAMLLLFTHGFSVFLGSRIQKEADSSKNHEADSIDSNNSRDFPLQNKDTEDVISLHPKDDISITVVPEEDILEVSPTHAQVQVASEIDNPTASPVDTRNPTASPVTTESPTASPVTTESPTASPVTTESPSASPVTTESPTAPPAATDAPTALPIVQNTSPQDQKEEVIITFPTDDNLESPSYSPTMAEVVSETSSEEILISVQEKEVVEDDTNMQTSEATTAEIQAQENSAVSPAVVLTREDAFVDFISRISSDGGSSLLELSGPQYAALQFLVEEDSLDPSEASQANQLRIIQRYALLSLYYGLSDGSLMDIRDGFGGDIVLANEENWGVGHECTWFGVECKSGIIDSLLLQNTNLNGEIPPELALLSNLRILDLSSNEIEGTIPNTIYRSLSSLEQIILRDNYLNGTIPSSIKELNLIRKIDMGDCYFEGTIPSEIGELLQLRELVLDDNGFTGALPTEIGNCYGLEVLDLHYNFLDGNIPSELGKLDLLEEVYVSANFFTGEIPVEFGRLSNVKVFWNYHNNMSGMIPIQLSAMNQLESLRLGRNDYQKQPIPDFVFTLQSLVDLNIEESNLDGELPTNLGELLLLESLEIDDNFISGLLPSEIGKLTLLEHIEIGGNSISGWLPTEIGLLVDLTSLSMAGNFIGWEIPSEIGNLVNLNVLDLHYNWLSGSLPDEITELGKLEILDLTYNYLNGTIPQNIGAMSSLIEFRAAIQSDINVDNIGFSGQLPVSMGLLENVELFEVFYNSLSGEIPSEIGSMSNLYEFNLEYNWLSGTVPSELHKLESLVDLYLAENDLSGSMPQLICDSGAVISIDCDVVECDCCECNPLSMAPN